MRSLDAVKNVPLTSRFRVLSRRLPIGQPEDPERANSLLARVAGWLLAGVLVLAILVSIFLVARLSTKVFNDVRLPSEILLAIPAYILIYALLTVLMLPGTVGTAAGGALFGFPLGLLAAYIAVIVGTQLTFVLGRSLRWTPFGTLRGENKLANRIDVHSGRSPFRMMLYLRLSPAVPSNALNYAAGLSAIRQRDYFAATAVGVVPGTLLTVLVAAGIASKSVATPIVAVAVVLTSALLFIEILKMRT